MLTLSILDVCIQMFPAQSWMAQKQLLGLLSVWMSIGCCMFCLGSLAGVIQICFFFFKLNRGDSSPNKGGTTEGGFLLSLYRSTFVDQDFPLSPGYLRVPKGT